MALLNREQLLKKAEFKIEKVEFENGDFVFVRQMSGREKDWLEGSMLKPVREKGKAVEYERTVEDFRAKLAVSTICDEKGNLLLTKDDIETISEHMTAAMLDKITEVASSLNKISEEDKRAIVKNFKRGPADDSPSGSAKS